MKTPSRSVGGFAKLASNEGSSSGDWQNENRAPSAPNRDDGLDFEAEGLASASDRVYDHIAVGYQQPIDAGWRQATILAALEGKPLTDKEQQPDDGEGDSTESNAS